MSSLNAIPRAAARVVLSRLPRSVRLSLLVQRRERYLRAAGMVFIHIPKAAGSSINQALYGRFMGHYTAAQVKSFGSAQVKTLPRFTVVRNPWARVYSAWRFSRIEKGLGDGVVVGMKPGLYDLPEFETFEQFVTEWLPRADMKKEDWVFHPQHNWFLDSSGRKIVDHIGRLEDLSPTVDWVRERTGRTLEIPHTNRSGDAVDLRQLYTPDTAAIVGHVYAEDVRRLGYAPPDL